jgi:hypothetical protein
MGCWNMLARTDRALIRALWLAPHIMAFADFLLHGPRSNGMLGALMASILCIPPSLTAEGGCRSDVIFLQEFGDCRYNRRSRAAE